MCYKSRVKVLEEINILICHLVTGNSLNLSQSVLYKVDLRLDD